MQILQTGHSKAGVWKTCENQYEDKVFTGYANGEKSHTQVT